MIALPVELLLVIADLVPRDSLPALARVHTRLCPIAQRVLYRHIVASEHLLLVPLLARKPHLARHVRSFHIALHAPVFTSFYVLLAVALRNMSDLHSLHLLVDSAASWVLRDPADYPSLVHFTSTFALDDHVVRFLQKTSSLRELEVDVLPNLASHTIPLPPSSVPHLEQFIGASRAAARIVPGRPVKSIHLNGSPLHDEDVPLLARSTTPVRVLAAVTNASPVAFLHLLHRHLPDLAFLRVMSTQDLFQPPSAEFYEQVANALSLFSDLTAFELSGIHWGSQRKRDDTSKRVWQSSPLASLTLSPDEHLLFGTDIFLAY